ncbi:short-chain dehydrogenase/reductase family 16C member 6-like isoform X2 [Ornithodoros turicata]|uniref:short-chain dehydrogenase/reductase family 16C member 6-like isoform X2 n=1 Tax=Ornithodoros turicata TaxID=34597 RepID=UPI00313A1411
MGVTEVLSVLLEFLMLMGRCLWIAVLELVHRPPPKSLAGKVVLVTGSGHGVGRELALRFARLGAKVVLVDINTENNESVALEVKQEQGSAFAYQCDVSDEVQVQKLAQKVTSQLGAVSVLVNNAAVVNCQPMMQLNSTQVRRTVDVNLLAHFWLIREFLPGMLAQKEGHIVALSSIAGFIGTGYLTDYCASKFAVRGLMYALEEELYQMDQLDNIKLTIVCPMAINTGMFKQPKSRRRKWPNGLWRRCFAKTKKLSSRIISWSCKSSCSCSQPRP